MVVVDTDTGAVVLLLDDDTVPVLLEPVDPPCTFKGTLCVPLPVPDDMAEDLLAEPEAGRPLLVPERVLILSLLP